MTERKHLNNNRNPYKNAVHTGMDTKKDGPMTVFACSPERIRTFIVRTGILNSIH